MSYIPENHNHVSPYLVVDNANEIIDFLIHVFDATELVRFYNDDGSVMHAEVKIFDSVIMLGEGRGIYPTRSGTFHVYVPDCDAYLSKAVEFGASIDREAETFPDGDRRGSCIGPQGNTWTMATHLGTQ